MLGKNLNNGKNFISLLKKNKIIINMYKLLILVISLISLQGCGQNNKVMNEKVTEILGNLYKDVKYYDQRINYHAQITIGGCNFEVLINDFPVHQYF